MNKSGFISKRNNLNRHGITVLCRPLFLCLLLLLISGLFLTGCTAQKDGMTAGTEEAAGTGRPTGTEPASEATGNPVTVCLEQGRGFSAKSYIQTVTGDAEFQLSLQEDYEITGCSYEDYTVEEADNGYMILCLKDVKYPARVTITCEIPEAVILYDPNGGSFTDTGSTEPLRIAYQPSVHYRINTLTGASGEASTEASGEASAEAPGEASAEVTTGASGEASAEGSTGKTGILREGYVLTGWNTAPDGSGQHIGLGSRVTVEKSTELKLYAEWQKETEAELFAWEDTAEGICLTAYTGGDTDRLVVPEEIDGKTVTAIGKGFAQGISIESLVFPDSVVTVEEGAFRNCAIRQIYFSDTLQEVSDASFEGSRPIYWHINAAAQPRYQAISDICVFADKMDLLLLHENEKKLLLYSGCSMNYGLDSQLLAEEYPDYTVLNLGAVGGTNVQFQLEIILQYIHSGDIFIHAPEQGSPYQLMSSTACENRMFIAVEGNYDLLASVDMNTLGEGAFDAFRTYNEKRSSIEPCTYEDQYIPVNSYGDNDSNRISSNTERFDPEYGLRPDCLTGESLNRLCSYYDRIREAGADVYLSYAPISTMCCNDEEIEEFSRAWEQGTEARGYTTISRLQDYVMEAEYFYDSDYHLTTEGAEIRTEQLMDDIGKAISDGA